MSGTSTVWRRFIIYLHRWLGIAGSLLFLSWFASGIVLMYAGMPELTRRDRLLGAPPLNLARATVGVNEAAVQAGFTPASVLIGMHGDRPVYRFAGAAGWSMVYADTGALASGLMEAGAVEVVARFDPAYAATATYDARLTTPDQWTLQSRAFFPLHRVRVNDRADTVVYVSDRTAEPVMRTTRRTRRWAYAGAVLHWLYFTPLRSRTALWSDLVIWLSILGCVVAASGLIWGLWRLSPAGRYRLRGSASHTPYAGLMRWHHYGGLVFGLVTFTWVLSGALSMEPWGWPPSRSLTRPQRAAISGGAPRLGPLTASGVREGAAAIATAFAPKELEVVHFRGEPYLLASDPRPRPEAATLPTTLATLATTRSSDQRLVSVLRPEEGAFPRFENAAFDGLAEAAMPGVPIVDATWLRGYDDYYYDRDDRRPLPVLRVRYGDAVATWLYFDPFRGAIARKEERLTRLNRWLYHGLHSLDFRFLYAKRPLWDVVVILLSLGGLLVSVTSLGQGWRRLRRHAGRMLSS